MWFDTFKRPNQNRELDPAQHDHDNDHDDELQVLNSLSLSPLHIVNPTLTLNLYDHNEEEKNDARLNIVVGGAGFTGIEFVGELANRLPELCKEYDIDS